MNRRFRFGWKWRLLLLGLFVARLLLPTTNPTPGQRKIPQTNQVAPAVVSDLLPTGKNRWKAELRRGLPGNVGETPTGALAQANALRRQIGV
jgi:hypothetical protein